jgi:hypothetical protein
MAEDGRARQSRPKHSEKQEYSCYQWLMARKGKKHSALSIRHLHDWRAPWVASAPEIPAMMFAKRGSKRAPVCRSGRRRLISRAQDVKAIDRH